MKKLLLAIMLIGPAIFQGCAFFDNLIHDNPEIYIRDTEEINHIAVLNFSRKGSFLPQSAGSLAADKLSDALFIKGKYDIIDRSRVNSAQAGIEIPSTEFVNSDEIQKLGLKLKAAYLIFGRLQNDGDIESLVNSKNDKKLNVSFRIISVLNSETVGVVNYSASYSEGINEAIEKIMNRIVLKMVEK